MDYVGLKCEICGTKFNKGDDVVVCPDCGTPMHRNCYSKEIGCPNKTKHSDGFVYEGFEKIKKSAQKSHESSEEEKNVDSLSVNENRKVVRVDLQKLSVAVSQKEKTNKPGYCVVCGTQNRPSANFCDNCGARIKEPVINFGNMLSGDEDSDFIDPKNFASSVIGQNSDITANSMYEEDVSAGDVACYVVVNTPYYLKAFKKISNGENKFNFSAAIFSGVWFLYRKLYKLGGLLLSIQALLYAIRFYTMKAYTYDVMVKLLNSIGLSTSQIPSLTLEQYMKLSAEAQNLTSLEQFYMMMPTILLLLQIGVMVFCGFSANKFYYKKCLENIRLVKSEAEENSMSRADISKSLYINGGVNALLAGFFGFFYVMIVLFV